MRQRLLCIAFITAFLLISSIILTVEIESVHADPDSYTVSFTTNGLPSFYHARVWVDGVFNTTISGGQTISFIMSDTNSHTIRVSDYVPDGYPYHTDYSWQSGHNWVSFYCRDNSWTFSSAPSSTYIFYYLTLFYLRIQSDHGPAIGMGWYPAGTWARISVQDIVSEGYETRYRFDSWSGAVFLTDSAQASNSVLMDGPKTIIVNWIPQFKLTINSVYGNPVGDGWYDIGSTATVSVTTPIDASIGTRYAFVGWTGDMTSDSSSVSINMNTPYTLTANWKTQYLLTVDANGGAVNRTSDWFDEGLPVIITASKISNELENQSRLNFKEWSGDVNSEKSTITIIMDSPKTLVANWYTQYYLQLISKHGEIIGEGWYDSGSTASFSVSPIEVPIENWGYLGAKHIFSSWKGDVVTKSPESSIVMDGPKTIQAEWTDDYVMTYTGLTLGATVLGAAMWKRSAITPRVKPFVRRLYRKSLKDDPVIKPTPKYVRVCPRCRTEIDEKTAFCIECGDKQA